MKIRTFDNFDEYRTWLKTYVRIFDETPSVLMPGDRRSNMHIADLEAATEMLGLDWRSHVRFERRRDDPDPA